MTVPSDYREQLSADNPAVPFIDNQTTLTLSVPSIDMTLLKTNTEGLAKLAKFFDLPAVLTTNGGAEGLSGPLLNGITDVLFPETAPINRMGNLNAMDDQHFAEAVKATGGAS